MSVIKTEGKHPLCKERDKIRLVPPVYNPEYSVKLTPTILISKDTYSAFATNNHNNSEIDEYIRINFCVRCLIRHTLHSI